MQMGQLTSISPHPSFAQRFVDGNTDLYHMPSEIAMTALHYVRRLACPTMHASVLPSSSCLSCYSSHLGQHGHINNMVAY